MNNGPGPRLEWGVQAQFAGYVRTMGDGKVLVEGGAAEPSAGVFSFPLVDHANGGHGATEYTFGGTARFVGHWGMLNLPVGDIRVVVESDDTARISIADPAGSERRVPFATGGADRSAGRIRIESALTEDGSELFLYRYRKGFALDPAVIVLD